MTRHYTRKDKRGRRYVLSEDETGKMSRVYLKKCKNCKIYKIPASAERDLCFTCERGKEKEKEKLKSEIKELLEVTESIVEKESQIRKLKEEALAIKDQINYLKIGKAKIHGKIRK